MPIIRPNYTKLFQVVKDGTIKNYKTILKQLRRDNPTALLNIDIQQDTFTPGQKAAISRTFKRGGGTFQETKKDYVAAVRLIKEVNPFALPSISTRRRRFTPGEKSAITQVLKVHINEFRGRAKGSGGTSRASTLNIPGQSQATDKQAAQTDGTMEADALGHYAAGCLVSVGRMIGGEEWEPKTEPIDEMGNLQAAFGDYFRAKDIRDVPPGLALSIAIIGYAAPRFTAPKTKERVLSWWDRIKLKMAAKKLEKERRAKLKRESENQGQERPEK